MNHPCQPILLALSADFLKAYARIPRDKQTRVRDFIEKFKANPNSPGLNYERIQGASDPNLRSVRIDQQYRAIVLQPEHGNVHMLLWVDNHDDAYQWAQNRCFHIHPETGSLQVVDVTQTPATPPPATSAPPQPGLFQALRDRQLRRFGLPDDAIPIVRTLQTEQDLEAVADRLPQEAYEALLMIAAGYSLEEADHELASAAGNPVDTSDFAKALQNPDSKRRFVLIEDDYELEAMLEAPLAQWRVFLHPTQRKIVQMNANGPIRVLGGAGTGKTVVAMHRAKWLAENVFTQQGQRILFTTFTRNLAVDIAENLKTICSPTTLQKIEVVNIDAWTTQFLRRNGYQYSIMFGDRLTPLWQDAMNLASTDCDLDDQFYRDEWNTVIQPQGITTRDQYVQTSRTGRGRRLSRKDRVLVWPVFEEYRAQLHSRKWKELTDAVRDARVLLEQSGPVLPYVSIIVDEAQDMGPEIFRLLRQIVPPESATSGNDLFITGDAHQRIYNKKIVLSHCGIEIRGRARKLRVNYRTTEETRQWAVRLLEDRQIDDLDGGSDPQTGYTSLLHGPPPEVVVYPDFTAECAGLQHHLLHLQSLGAPGDSICVVARTKDLLAQYEGALKADGLPTYRIERKNADNRKQPGIRMATMHRVKGLEFDHVVIAGVNDQIVPLQQALAAENPFEKTESETRERALLYVAATRARKSLRVTAHGTPSPFLTTN